MASISIVSRLVLTIIHLLIALGAYCLMLLVMTFNVPVLFATAGGLAIGHTIFKMLPSPKLPVQYQVVSGKSNYVPEMDNCCSSLGDPLNQ